LQLQTVAAEVEDGALAELLEIQEVQEAEAATLTAEAHQMRVVKETLGETDHLMVNSEAAAAASTVLENLQHQASGLEMEELHIHHQ
jgi:hypothetical protein